MSIDDVTTMWRNLPEVFDLTGIPASWEEEWSFGAGATDPTQARPDRSWLDYVVLEGPANSQDALVPAERRWIGPTLSDHQGFGGAPLPRDAASEVPPPDALGFYLPFHYFYPDWWGIYIVADGVRELATWLWNDGEGELSYSIAVHLAHQFIYRHESFHHAVEAFGSRLEVTHRIPVFTTGVRAFRRRQMPPDATDEALASAYAVQHCSDWLRDEHPYARTVGERAIWSYIRLQPPPYDSALDYQTRDSWVAGRDDLAEAIQRESRPELPDLPSALWSMFGHAFTGFARINSRVQYVVRRGSSLHHRMSADGLFLRYRDVAKRLRQAGCREVRTGRGSHIIWEGPRGTRAPVPNHGGRDLAPGTLRSILRNLGIDDAMAGSATR